jgi:hypothetical protein
MTRPFCDCSAGKCAGLGRQSVLCARGQSGEEDPDNFVTENKPCKTENTPMGFTPSQCQRTICSKLIS